MLVGDDELRSARALMIAATRNRVEPAGAAALAAAVRLRDQLKGRGVALILSGVNASREQLLDVLRREHAAPAKVRDEPVTAAP